MEVYYTQNSYTLNETEGYVEICVEAKSLGISEEFYINAITTDNQISKFTLNINVANRQLRSTACVRMT